jgi:flagellar basal-body rod modification protein FlgD
MTVNTSGHAVTIQPPKYQPEKARVLGQGEESEIQKDMFLKLMIAQLKNQDPTSPMDQKDMMASMTQFSQVEQMQNMTKAMETLSLAQGVNMVGQHVDYRFVTRDESGVVQTDEVRSGKVVSVEQIGGQVQLMLTNGVRVKPMDVTSMSQTPRPPQALIGKYVTYAHQGTDAQGKPATMTLTGRVTSVTDVDGVAKLAIGTRAIAPESVITVSNIPLGGGPGGFPDNPPTGWT